MDDVAATGSNIRIRAEPLIADPDSCRFTVSRAVHPGGPFLFRDADEARGSALPERLFAIEGVTSVLVADDIVTVRKDPAASWADLMKPVGAAIRAQLATGEPALVPRDDGPRAPVTTDAALLTAVQDVLDTTINPAIASHSGLITVVGVRDRVVYVKMSGGCQGCSAASVTLRQGVEAMLREEIPEIADIVDTTDHAAGETPFFR